MLGLNRTTNLRRVVRRIVAEILLSELIHPIEILPRRAVIASRRSPIPPPWIEVICPDQILRGVPHSDWRVALSSKGLNRRSRPGTHRAEISALGLPVLPPSLGRTRGGRATASRRARAELSPAGIRYRGCQESEREQTEHSTHDLAPTEPTKKLL